MPVRRVRKKKSETEIEVLEISEGKNSEAKKVNQREIKKDQISRYVR
jgi:hypothetical protein